MMIYKEICETMLGNKKKQTNMKRSKQKKQNVITNL